MLGLDRHHNPSDANLDVYATIARVRNLTPGVEALTFERVGQPDI